MCARRVLVQKLWKNIASKQHTSFNQPSFLLYESSSSSSYCCCFALFIVSVYYLALSNLLFDQQ